jgi:hypothetical protein
VTKKAGCGLPFSLLPQAQAKKPAVTRSGGFFYPTQALMAELSASAHRN